MHKKAAELSPANHNLPDIATAQARSDIG